MKDSISYRVFTVCNLIFMFLLGAVCLFPFLHTLAKSLNDGYDTMLGGITIFPRKLTFQNFKVLFMDSSIYSSFLVSVLRLVIGTVLALIVQFSAAYSLTKKDLFGKKAILIFMATTMFVSGGMIPQYLLYVKTGLINNFWVYIIPGICGYYNIIVLRSFILSSIPDSLCEAASLDGAGELRILWQIVAPLSKPVLATVGLWAAVGHWNAWEDTLYYVTNEKLFTLQYKLMQVVKESEKLKSLLQEAALNGESLSVDAKSTPESLIAAQVMITTIPIIIVYPFLQKYFVKGVTLGAVKQ